MKLTTEPTLEALRPEPMDDPVVGYFIMTHDGYRLRVDLIEYVNLPGIWYDCTDDDGGDHLVHESSVVAVTPTRAGPSITKATSK